MTDFSSIMPKQRQQLHVSGINMLNECGFRFMFRYIMGIRRPPSAYLHVGTAVDESVNKNLGNKITAGELLPRQDAIDLAAAKFEERIGKEPIELDPDEKRAGLSPAQVAGEAKDKSVNLAGKHYDDAAPTIFPKHVQRKFAINMDPFLRARAKVLHRQADDANAKYDMKLLHLQAQKLNAAAKQGLDFVGELDIVEEIESGLKQEGEPLWMQTRVRDTKTAGKSPTKSLMDGSDKPGIADDSEQLTAYALATQILDKRLPVEMVLDYLIQTPARHDLKYVITRTKRTNEDLQVFLNRFANAVQVIRTGMFVPANPTWWGCSEQYCGYWHMCPMAKRPKSALVPEITKVEEKPANENTPDHTPVASGAGV